MEAAWKQGCFRPWKHSASVSAPGNTRSPWVSSLFWPVFPIPKAGNSRRQARKHPTQHRKHARKHHGNTRSPIGQFQLARLLEQSALYQLPLELGHGYGRPETIRCEMPEGLAVFRRCREPSGRVPAVLAGPSGYGVRQRGRRAAPMPALVGRPAACEKSIGARTGERTKGATAPPAAVPGERLEPHRRRRSLVQRRIRRMRGRGTQAFVSSAHFTHSAEPSEWVCARVARC